MHKKILLILAIFLFASVGINAGWLTPQAAMVAQQAAPVAVGTLSDISTVTKSAANLLYLPRGALQLGLSPLPGPTIAGGLKEMSTGVRATTVLVGKTLKLPVNFINRSFKRVGTMSPLSLVGL